MDHSKHVFIVLLYLFCFLQGSAQTNEDSLVAEGAKQLTIGNYGDALQLNIAALKLAQNKNNCIREAYETFQVARCYYYLKDYTVARNYLLNAYKISSECHADSISGKIFQLTAIIYQEIEMPDSAVYYYKEARKLLEGTRKWIDLSMLYGEMGELYYRQLHNDSEAQRCFLLCEQYALLSASKSTIAFSYIKRSIYASVHNDCKIGAEFAQKASRIYNELQDRDGEMYALNVILFAKTQCNDKGLYELVAKIQGLKDTIFQTKTSEKIAKYKTLYETEKTNAENKDLKESNTRKNILLLSVVFMGIAFILLIGVSYNRFRLKKENELEKERSIHRALQFKAVLEGVEQERTRIARELHDSVGQLLSTAKLNVSVVMPAADEDETVLENAMKLIDAAIKEVRTISHDLMPSSLTELGLRSAIRELVRSLNVSQTIQVKLNMDDAPVFSSNTEVIIYRVIQEIFHNIIEHACATEINFNFNYSEGVNIIEITDNGVGFDPNEIKMSDGLGWQNIFLRVELLNGKIDVKSNKNEGTSIVIQFSE